VDDLLRSVGEDAQMVGDLPAASAV
jgi:hypothetical protein